MPLLAPEPSLYPETLLETAASADDRWWVLHTRPRAEKGLARQLHRRRISFYLPQYERRWRSASRHWRTSLLPLFPGYVFLRGDADSRRHALETNLVVQSLTVGDQRQLVDDLRRVHELIVRGAGLTPEDRLRPGSPVRLIDGPLAGLEGTILRRGKRLKFFVAVRLLQQGVSAEVESWMFEPL